MKGIELTQGYVAVVDDEDFEELNQYRWMVQKRKGGAYAIRCNMTPDGPQTLAMHRVILGVPDDLEVDHRNGDGLDNRRCNLRVATHAQNIANRKKTWQRTTSRFIGVRRSGKKWQAVICVNKRTICLGSYSIDEEAARAYDAAARKHFGEFASLNFPESHELPPIRVSCAPSAPRGGKPRSSRFPGVWKVGDRWAASIMRSRKRLWLGYFPTEEEAAAAYRAAADTAPPGEAAQPEAKEEGSGDDHRTEAEGRD